MKIHTTEAVRRFNAVLEIVDLLYQDKVGFDCLEPVALHDRLVSDAMPHLAADLRYSGQPLGYFPKESTKSACRHNAQIPNDGPDKDHYAWKCFDCGYVYGKEAEEICHHLNVKLSGKTVWECCDCGKVLNV